MTTPTEARALWPEMYIAESLPPSSQVYLCDEADTIIRSLADQVEALQKDAERYQQILRMPKTEFMRLANLASEHPHLGGIPLEESLDRAREET